MGNKSVVVDFMYKREKLLKKNDFASGKIIFFERAFLRCARLKIKSLFSET